MRNSYSNDFLYVIKHKLFRHTLLYSTTNVISSALPFLLLPVLTRYLTPSEYGIVATFQVLLLVMLVFVGLSMHGAVAVNFFKLDKQDFNIYVSNVILILSISFPLTFGIVYIIRSYFSYFVNFPETWLPIVVVVALFQAIFTLMLTLWQAEQRPLPYSLFHILQTTLNIGLSLIFVIWLDWRWQGRLLGILFASVIFGSIGIFMIFNRVSINFSFNKNYIKDALLFGIPTMPHALGAWVITGIDRIFINSMVNVAATGLYTVGYQVGMIIGLLANSFNQSWSPFLFEKLSTNNDLTKLKIVKFTYLYHLGIIALTVLLSFTAPFFLNFFVGKTFYAAHKYVLWISLAYAAHAMYLMVVNYIFYVKKTYILAWVTFLSACVNIFLNYFLIRANGVIGAAQATTLTFFLRFVLTWLLSSRVYKMPWGMVKC